MARFRFVQWLLVWLSGLSDFTFEWDEGNQTKSFRKHAVTCEEAEEVFTQRRFVPLGQQVQPPCPEPRFGIIGETSRGKLLFLVFALRNETIRVVSTRPMNRKEKELFYASLRQK